MPSLILLRVTNCLATATEEAAERSPRGAAPPRDLNAPKAEVPLKKEDQKSAAIRS